MTQKTYTRAFDIGKRCDKGRRPNNEDKVLLVEDWRVSQQAQRRELGRLYIVADGVGGNANGEVASEWVVQELMRHYYEGGFPAEIHPAERLRLAIQATSREIFEESLRQGNDMRSTVVAALVLDPEGARDRRKVIVANIGDSPALLFRRNEPPVKLTQDHVQRDGTLQQAMGDEQINVSIRNEALRPDDILVLCSDGLTDGVKGPISPATIGRVVRASAAQAASEELVNLAKRAGSSDNITAVVIRNGDKPLPLRLLAQIGGVLVTLLLMAGIAYGAGFVSGPPSQSDGLAPPEVYLDPNGNNLTGDHRPTATLPPTATPTTTPTATPTALPKPTAQPTARPRPTTAPAPSLTAAEVVPSATPEPPPTEQPTSEIPTQEPPTPEPTPSENGSDGGDDDDDDDDDDDSGGNGAEEPSEPTRKPRDDSTQPIPPDLLYTITQY